MTPCCGEACETYLYRAQLGRYARVLSVLVPINLAEFRFRLSCCVTQLGCTRLMQQFGAKGVCGSLCCRVPTTRSWRKRDKVGHSFQFQPQNNDALAIAEYVTAGMSEALHDLHLTSSPALFPSISPLSISKLIKSSPHNPKTHTLPSQWPLSPVRLY
jgi:hypothetical protein